MRRDSNRGERVRRALRGRGAVVLLTVIMFVVPASARAPAALSASTAQPPGVDLLTDARVRVDGAAAESFAGYSVAGAGDVDGDGVHDVIVGAPLASNNGRELSGSAYVVLGRSSKEAVDLANLGSRGFRIDGAAAKNLAGASVEGAGDVNHDGLDDVVVGAPLVGDGSLAGAAYVVFGRTSTSRVDLAALGAGGFRIDAPSGGVLAGYSVAGAGDVNGDGRSDLIVGSPFDADDLETMMSGSAYVVYGKASTGTVNLGSLGSGGFRIRGASKGDFAGYAVAGPGDVNGDGRDDLLVGAPYGDPGSVTTGAAYLVFGKASTGTVELGSLGASGFRMDGPAANDLAGLAVAGAGDANGDGLADIVVGAPAAEPEGAWWRGAAFVVFGKSSTGTVPLNVLGSGGYRIDGGEYPFFAGYSVAAAGDANGDGLDDVIVGAPGVSDYRYESGAAFLVYGKASTNGVDLDAPGLAGQRITGANDSDIAGASVGTAGDVDGDGLDDLLVGAPFADNNGRNHSGSAYIVRSCLAWPSVSGAPDGPGGAGAVKPAPVPGGAERTRCVWR